MKMKSTKEKRRKRALHVDKGRVKGKARKKSIVEKEVREGERGGTSQRIRIEGEERKKEDYSRRRED